MNPKMPSIPDQNYTLSLEKEISTSRNIDNASNIEKGIPKIYYTGVEGDFNVMVMDMLGFKFNLLNNYIRVKS